MPLLEALLALALTLLSLAMIATLIVEMIHRIAETRARNLKTMLEKFYDTKLKEIFKIELQISAEELDKYKTELINELIENPLVKEGKQAGAIKSYFKERASFKNLTSLSTEDLFKRLASTNFGKKIKKKTEAKIDEIVDSLSHSYDEIGAATSDLFKRKAQITSLLVGIVVAFVFNANAIQIYKSYLFNPQARAATVVRVDAALENFTKMTENMKESDTTTSTGNTTSTDNQKGYETQNELVEDVNIIREEIKNLKDMSFPIGYTSDKAPLKWPKDSLFKSWFNFVIWVLEVFGTGLLIGLGGPFWFNVVRKLSNVLQVIRGVTPAAAVTGDSTTVSADPKKSNRDAFKMTGELPEQIKAQAELTAVTKAATEADEAVKIAADALIKTREAAGNNPNKQMMTAITQAEKALKIATETQKKRYARKKEAEKSI